MINKTNKKTKKKGIILLEIEENLYNMDYQVLLV